MSRTFPVYALLLLGTMITSVLAGFLLASWTVGGIAPAHAAPPTLARSEPIAFDDSWRAAGYARIGLWEEPTVGHAAGSSRL